eukprot:COSAG02_NODE_693_length_18428_cov_268.516722_6_plen_1206_part_00
MNASTKICATKTVWRAARSTANPSFTTAGGALPIAALLLPLCCRHPLCLILIRAVPPCCRAYVATKPTLYITPPDVEDDVTNRILALSLESCEGSTFLAGSEARFPEIPNNPWPGVFSVYGQESSLLAPGEKTTSPVALLYGEPYNARTFGIAGTQTYGAEDMAKRLREEIEHFEDAKLTAPVSLTTSMASTALHESMQSVAKTQPDVFIGIGDGHGVAFESMLSFFAGKGSNRSGYSPRAAFYMGGLAVSSGRWRNSYTHGVPDDIVKTKKLDVGSKYLPCHGHECWSFDQWMGFVPWTRDMPHAGPSRWPTELSNPYGMVADNPNAPHLGMRQRYLGSAEDFSQVASAWLKRNRESEHGLSPSFYHAKAAASLVLFQMAVELAPEGDGFGLLYTHLTRDRIEAAMHDMNNSQGVETFWGPIRILKDEGWNHFFKGMSIGQFRDNHTYPSVVRYTGHSKNFTTDASFPAHWPDWCLVHGLELNLFDECPFTYLHKTEIIVWSVFILVSALVVCCLARTPDICCAKSSRALHRSLLANSEAETATSSCVRVPDSSEPNEHGQLWTRGICWLACTVGATIASGWIVFSLFEYEMSLVDITATVLTFGTAMPAFLIVPRLKRRLDDPEVLQHDLAPTGLFGGGMAIMGIAGAGTHMWFCISLYQCHEIGLFTCAVFSALLTLTSTVYLICYMRTKLIQHDDVATWYRENRNGKQTVFIMLLACVRLDILALLRLRVCGYDVVACPMKNEHFQWVRYAGIYQCITEDLSSLVLAVLHLTSSSEPAGAYQTIAIIVLPVRTVLIVASVCEKSGQWLAHREAQRGAHLRQTIARDGEGANDALERQGIRAHVQPANGQVFSNKHVRLLRPNGWRNQIIGKGAFGTVYKATWGVHDVAVKELVLPVEPHGASIKAKQIFAKNIRTTKAKFIKEVKLLAKHSHHDNLVRLLGWADEPYLYIVLEYCHGQSLDDQLYVEGWQPPPASVLHIAHGVAKGMAHLHTAFKNPVIHRDLKSANLMLTASPMSAEQTFSVKIADFGLTREVCESVMPASTIGGAAAGTVLWMAPELMNGEDNYDEKIDVYSYAMCLIELVSCKKPWTGSKLREHSIPAQVIQGQRPEHQLERANHVLRQLIQDCWSGDPYGRPVFSDIVIRIQTMIGSPGAQQAMPLAVSRPASPSLGGPKHGIDYKPESEPEPEPASRMKRYVPAHK